jgi:PAS domain S-box-containing protein
MTVQRSSPDIGASVGDHVGEVLPPMNSREMVMVSIARVAATINAEHDPESALELICREAYALFAVDSTILWVRSGEELVAARAIGMFDIQIQGFRVPVIDPTTFACRCFRSRSPVLEQQLTATNAGNQVMAQLAPASAVLCVPLIHRDEVMGVLALRECRSPDHFSQADLEAATLFADMAAVAVSNARLHEEAERRAMEAAILGKIGRIVASGRDVAETSESFARELRNLIFFHRVAITLLEGWQSYKIFLSTGLEAADFKPGTVKPLAGSGVEWVAKHRKSHVIHDLDLEQTFHADHHYLEAGMRSAIRVPLIERGVAVGCLTLVSAVPSAYGSREVELLEQVAGQMAGVFANAQMAETQRALLSRLSSLHYLTDAALSSLDLNGMLDALLERSIEIVGADSGMVLLLEQEKGELLVQRARWLPGEAPRDYRRTLGQGVSGRVALTGEPCLVEDVEHHDSGGMRFTLERGIRSVLAVPMLARGKIIGVCRLESLQAARFNRQHLELMQVAAERMGVAVDNAQLMQEARESAAHEALIHRIASSVGSSLDLDRVMATAARELREAIGASRCVVALGSSQSEVAEARWEACAEGVGSSFVVAPPCKQNADYHWAFAAKLPWAIEDVESDPRVASLPSYARATGVRSVLATALYRGEELVGLLLLHQCDRTRRWTRRESELVQAVAAQLVVAVENASLYEDTDERLRARVSELGSLVRLGMAVSQQLSLDIVIQRAAEEGVRALHADRCSVAIMELERGTLVSRAAHESGGPAESGVGIGMTLAQHPSFYRAMASRNPVLLALDDPAASSSEAWMLRQLKMSAAIVAPMSVGDRAIGTVFFGRGSDRPGFTEDDMSLARALAGTVAVALQNATLFQEVQTQKSRTEALFASMSEGVCAVDVNMRIAAVNPWLEAMVGYRADQLVGSQCGDVMCHTDEEGNRLCSTSCPLRTTLQEGTVTEPTTVFVHTAWGELLPVLLSAAPIRDELMQVTGAVSVWRDVSREWQMDRLRSNIISVVSHEFRTPLTSIIGFSEFLLTREATEEEQRSSLELVYKEGLRMEALVNDFLDVSRLDAGRTVLNPESLDPGDVVSRAVNAYLVRCGQQRLRGDVQPGLPRVSADPDRVDQILDNLISNAVKYSPDGTQISLLAQGASGRGEEYPCIDGCDCPDWIVFTVEDRGFGIPSDQLAEIFKPFHRVEGEVTRRIRGTGLGLSIVKSLVELHGGKVWVDSEVGAGSSFHIALKVVGE